MIQVKNVSFSYGKKPVLKNLNLTLEKGKLYAVVGPNGSGKTTLIRLLSRQIKPGGGSLTLDGTAYESFSRKEFARQTALLPQGRNTPATTVFDLISCGRYPYLDVSRRLTQRDLEAVYSAMTATDTRELAQRNVKTLSGGERQRVYMAMLYAQDTPYVLLDEPATHLDMAYEIQIMKLLEKMRTGGKCVVAVLHDLSAALRYADEVILVSGGGIVSVAGAEETAESGNLTRVFGVRCHPVEIDGRREYVFTE